MFSLWNHAYLLHQYKFENQGEGFTHYHARKWNSCKWKKRKRKAFSSPYGQCFLFIFQWYLYGSEPTACVWYFLLFNDWLLWSRYWKLSLLVHPDKCPHPQAHQAFIKLNKAFKELQDPDKVSFLCIYGCMWMYERSILCGHFFLALCFSWVGHKHMLEVQLSYCAWFVVT